MVVIRLIVCLVILAVAAGCGTWTEDLSSTPASPATSTQPSVLTDSPTASEASIPPGTSTLDAAEVIPTATPQPTIAIDDLMPAPRLAYFHTISPEGDGPEQLASIAEFIILTYGDEQYRAALRQAGYAGLILQYINASQVNGPGPYLDSSAECDTQFVPQRNGIVRGVGDFCVDLHPHEDWFLHNGAGERLYSVTSGERVWYHMDPGNPGWRAYASQAIASEIVGPAAAGYDGAFLDNVELTLTRLTEQAVNADGNVREYANDDEYRESWNVYLEQVRAGSGEDIQIWASLVADPNHGALWSDYLDHLDGMMSPAFATGYDPLSVMAWENNLLQAEAAIRDGKSVVAVSRGAHEDAYLQEFALASYLLISDGEHAYFRYMSDETDQALVTLWTFPNYEIVLGAALGAREKSGANWRRDFQCGYVEVNPSTRRGSIVQTACENGSDP